MTHTAVAQVLTFNDFLVRGLFLSDPGLVDPATIPASSADGPTDYAPGCLRIAKDAAGAPVVVRVQWVIQWAEAMFISKASFVEGGSDEDEGYWEGECKGGVPTMRRPLARPTCIKKKTAFELWNASAVPGSGEQKATVNEYGCGPYSSRPYVHKTMVNKICCVSAFFDDAQKSDKRVVNPCKDSKLIGVLHMFKLLMGVEPQYRMEAFTSDLGMRVLRWLDLRCVRDAIFGARILMQQQRGARASTTTLAVWGDVSLRLEGCTVKEPRSKTRLAGSDLVQAVWHLSGCKCGVSDERLQPAPLRLDANGRLAESDFGIACPIGLLWNAKRSLSAYTGVRVDDIPDDWPIEANYFKFCAPDNGHAVVNDLPSYITLVKADNGSCVDLMDSRYWESKPVKIVTRAEEKRGVMYRGEGGLPGMPDGKKRAAAGVAFEIASIGIAVMPWSVGTVYNYVRKYVTAANRKESYFIPSEQRPTPMKPKRYGSRGDRMGAARDLHDSGLSWADVALQIGWAKEATARHYGQSTEPFEGRNLADAVRKRGSADVPDAAANAALGKLEAARRVAVELVKAEMFELERIVSARSMLESTTEAEACKASSLVLVEHAATIASAVAERVRGGGVMRDTANAAVLPTDEPIDGVTELRLRSASELMALSGRTRAVMAVGDCGPPRAKKARAERIAWSGPVAEAFDRAVIELGGLMAPAPATQPRAKLYAVTGELLEAKFPKDGDDAICKALACRSDQAFKNRLTVLRRQAAQPPPLLVLAAAGASLDASAEEES